VTQSDSWVWVVPFVIIAAITWKLKRRKGKYRERQYFPDSVKEKVLEKQHHIDNNVLIVIGY
jgi:hypothetical protein